MHSIGPPGTSAQAEKDKSAESAIKKIIPKEASDTRFHTATEIPR